MQKEIS